jgi:uncharacterized membrane protein YfcA
VWLKLGLLGLVAGAVTSSTAIGWGLITMPMLLLAFHFPAPVAVRMSILGFVGYWAVVAWRELAAASVNWPDLLALLIGGVVGGFVGTVVTEVVPARVLEKAIGVVTVVAGVALLFRK